MRADPRPLPEIRLPVILCGKEVFETGGEHVFNYDDAFLVRMPALEQAHVRAARESRSQLLRELSRLSILDITTFLSAVGRRWLAPDYAIRVDAERDASAVTGYPPRMVELDYRTIGEFMRWRSYAYDQIEADLGSQRILDEWCPVQASWVRAFARGIVLHLMVGNVPLANAGTILRGAITKNLALAKVSARDPVTPIALARAFVDTDPGHPMTRALTVGYWGHERTSVSEEAFRVADAICVWGGEEAIAAVKQRTPPGVPLLEFGPRWSLAVIDLDACDPEMAAWRMASELTFYDQEACFSPQRLFVKGERRAFMDWLAYYLDVASRHCPKQPANRDVWAHVATIRLEAAYRQWESRCGRDWTLIELDPDAVVDHPLGRTLFVHAVSSLDEVARHIDGWAQTLCCAPWELSSRYRDEWAFAGVDRIVDLGMTRHPRHGFTHDGGRPLTQLVRLVCHERALVDFYKYGDVAADWAEESLFFRH